ncbi:MAG: hypothetical protein HDS79_02020 [Bacteroidales bacterium]|nr:hypothetical protein [Bacteroidales bacterium]MDE7465203.1 hypothetical protein [Muribaculaceae bacterium]
MATSLISVIEELQSRISDLSERVESLREENRELREDVQVLRREVSDLTTERDRAKLDAEFLAVSHRLADNPDTIIETRRIISGLIRNIDRCIEMLKE